MNDDITPGLIVIGLLVVLGLWGYLAYYTVIFHSTGSWWLQFLPAVVVMAMVGGYRK